MGILKRLFGKGDEDRASSSSAVVPAPELARALHGPRVEITSSVGGEQDLVKLTGTTTFAREAVTRLAERHGIDVGGYLELTGTLQREPDNPADSMAVAVHVEGEKIGYLPGYLARQVDLSADGARTAQVQIFTEMLPKGLRTEAWAWLAEGEPEWPWSEFNRPPLSPPAKVAEHQAGIDRMVADALAGGGSRAQSFAGGMVNGVHYLQLVEPIKQLKREGRIEDALVLCTAAIQGAEAAREGREPAPWYTEQAAIIYRKLGRRDDEIAVLRRWLAVCPPERREGSRVKERLDKLVS
ncbi:HIRAN domain-containing protein [Microbacterium sp. 2FI]|uniref:HIRAN domain-containing protein n=1 Tax=Microbacterium sp. 2FI TaxID=2502193 RepID=UPI0010F82891|nr:HIRAN domain-containing protein [Microbacterium sp. 2FI]